MSAVIVQPRPQGAFPWLWGWGGKRPWMGWPIRHFDSLIDLGNLCKKMAK